MFHESGREVVFVDVVQPVVEALQAADPVRGRVSTVGLAATDEAARELATCLRLDEDFSPFHEEANRYPEFRWICETGSGRLLRAPTVFEDAVKMLLTTNCTWRLTTIMVTNLVQAVGEQFDETHWTFPTPEAVASLTRSRWVR